MLYPNFKELLSYEAAARGIGLDLNKKYSGDISGNFLSSFKGQGMEFDEVREYVYGDDVRNIEWRVTARAEKTHVKIYREERKRNVIIAVDNNNYMNFGTRNTFKNVQAARIAAILGFAANKNNDKVGLYIFGNQKNRFTYFKPVNTKKSLFNGLKALCNEKENLENYSLDGAIFNLKRIGANPNILFIISDFRTIDEDLEKNIFMLGRRPEVVLINIVDDSDHTIPDVGRLVMEYDDRRLMINTANRRGVLKYKKIFNQRQRNIKKIAARLKAKIININTKDDVLRELSLALR